MTARTALVLYPGLLLAMALSLPAEATYLSQKAKDSASGIKPAILIYWEPGMQAETADHLDVAVWESGRIVWRDKSPDYKKHTSNWSLHKGKVYAGAIAPQKVAQALAILRSKGVFKVKDWGYRIPDADCIVICVRSGTDNFRTSSSIVPPKSPPPQRSNPAWRKGREAWFLIRRVARGLIPAKGKEVRAPAELFDWAW